MFMGLLVASHTKHLPNSTYGGANLGAKDLIQLGAAAFFTLSMAATQTESTLFV
jgi:hypothetical protein